MSEQMKTNHFPSLVTLTHINRQTLEEVLVICRRKNVKPEFQATAKHKWHRLAFDPNLKKLPDLLEELNQGAKKAFGENV